jgi:hypothetical protein
LRQAPQDELLLNGYQRMVWKVIVNTRPPVPPSAASQSLVPKPRVAASFKQLVRMMRLVVAKAQFTVFY